MSCPDNSDGYDENEDQDVNLLNCIQEQIELTLAEGLLAQKLPLTFQEREEERVDIKTQITEARRLQELHRAKLEKLERTYKAKEEANSQRVGLGNWAFAGRLATAFVTGGISEDGE